MEHKIRYGTEVKKSNLLFGMCITLMTASVVLEKTAWASRPVDTLNAFAYVLKAMRYAAYAISLVCIFLKMKYRVKTICMIAFVAIVLCLSMFRSHDKTLFLYLFIFIAAMGVSGEFAIKCTLTVQAVIWLFVLICSFTGVIPDYYQIRGDDVRHYLGFTYTTTAPVLFYYMLLQYLFLKKGKLKFREYLVFMLISGFFYLATNTRFILAISVITLTFFLFYEKVSSKGFLLKSMRTIIVLFPFIALAICIWAAASYDSTNAVWASVDTLLSGRIRLANEALHHYGIRMFGQEIDWVGWGIQSLLHGLRDTYNYVDSSYLQILYEYGLVTTVCIMAAYSCLLSRAIARKQYYLVWIVLFILFHAIAEPFLIDLGVNPLLLLLMTKSAGEITSKKKISSGAGEIAPVGDE